MSKLKKTIAISSLLILVVALAACGGDKEAYGEISKISDTKITIKTGSYEEPSKPSDEKQSSAKPVSSSDSADGTKNDSKKQEPPAKPDGDGDGNGKPPKESVGFKSDGGTATYALSSNIDITGLEEGSLVKLSIESNKVTAIENVQDSSGDLNSDTGSTELTAAYTVDGKKQTSTDKDYESAEENVNSVLVKNKGNLTFSGGTLAKSGDTTSDDESNFYGLNAIFAVTEGSTATIDGTTLSSSGNGSNAIFATGKGAKITAKNFKIYTTGNSARGLDATYGGSITASNGDITTKGAHCAPIATDRGEGTINVSNTSVSAEGDGSPCIYSTGNITATKVNGSAMDSQIAVVEGKNSIKMDNCTLQGSGKNGIMLYQSTSGDAAEGQANLTATSSKLTSTSNGPMFYVTNTNASATLENTSLYFSSGVLVKASGNKTNNWGKEGENGGNFTLTGISQNFKGDITCDKISTVALALTKNSTFNGAINAKNTAKSASISLDKSSAWEVTADSYISSITNKNTKCTNIKANGCTIYYDKANKDNSWLKGKTITLPGGGKLTPAS